MKRTEIKKGGMTKKEKDATENREEKREKNRAEKKTETVRTHPATDERMYKGRREKNTEEKLIRRENEKEKEKERGEAR